MHMRIIEPGQHEFAAGINHFGLRAAPQVNFRARAHGHDAIADHRHCFRPGMLFIYRINRGVRYDQSCRWLWLAVRPDARHK